MKTIVVYTSQTGFTKRYAEWIAEETGADCSELSAVKNEDLSDYDAIVYGGWALGGSIRKVRWFKENVDKWADKKLIAFCVGASPIENPDVDVTLKQIFQEAKYDKVNAFYCPGGLNYEKMPVSSKVMMKMFIRVLKAKKDKTEAEREMIRMISTSYDISDKKYIEPILRCLKSSF